MSSTEALQPQGDNVLYAIDVHLPIWRSILKAVAHSIASLQQLGDRKFQVGVFLYGLDKLDAKPPASTTPSPLGQKFPTPIVGGCCALINLHQPKVEDLKLLLQLVEGETGVECASTSESLLALAQTAKVEFFSQREKHFNRLVIFSDADPSFPASELQVLQQQFQSIAALGVLVVPVLFTDQDDHEEFASEFWSQIPYMPSNMSTAALSSGLRVSLNPVCLASLDESALAESLDLLVRQKAERKRVEFRGVLSCQSLQLGICGYAVASPHRQRYQGLFHRSAHGHEPVHRVYSDPPIDSIHKEFVLNPGCGGVEVSSQDLEELRAVIPPDGTPQIRIHRFLPPQRCQVEPHYRLYRSIFIVPSNFKIANSKRAFAALHRSMVRKQVVGLATYVPKQTGRSPMLGLLYAFDPATLQNEQVSQVCGPSPQSGMYFVKLPFSQDIRGMQMVQESETPANGRLEKKMAKLVNKFYYEPGFDPQLFSNPTNEQFAKVLGYLALGPLQCPPEELMDEEGNDNTVPNYKSIRKHAGKLCEKIEELLVPDGHETGNQFIPESAFIQTGFNETVNRGPKHEGDHEYNDSKDNESKDGGHVKIQANNNVTVHPEFPDDMNLPVKGPLKRPFASTSMSETTPGSRRGILNTYRLPELRAQLVELGMDPRGKKQDLVERLARYYDALL